MEGYIYRFIIDYYSENGLPDEDIYWIHNKHMKFLVGPVYAEDLFTFNISGDKIVEDESINDYCVLIQHDIEQYNKIAITTFIMENFNDDRYAIHNYSEIIEVVKKAERISYCKLATNSPGKLICNMLDTKAWQIELVDKTLELKIDNYLNWKLCEYIRKPHIGINLYVASPHAPTVGPISLSDICKRANRYQLIYSLLHNITQPYRGNHTFNLDTPTKLIQVFLPSRIIVLFYYIQNGKLYPAIKTAF